MFKEMFGKAKCRIGLHVGEWVYEESAECTQIRKCMRCAAESRKVEHSFGGWQYASTPRCEQTRRCARCGETAERVVHDWGEVCYRGEGDCEQVQACTRCGAERPAPILHVWGEGEYPVDGDCVEVNRCVRCTAVSAGSTVHAWGEWRLNEAQDAAVRVCTRCGEIGVREGPTATTARAAVPPAPPAAPAPPVSDPDARRAELFANLKAKQDTLRVLGAQEISALLDAMHESGRETLEQIGEQQPDRLDPRVIGHWRGTNFLSSGGMSRVTDLHLELEADGRFVYSTQSAGVGGSIPLRVKGEGTWTTTDGTLDLQWDDGSYTSLAYHVEAGDLLLPDAANWPKTWQLV